MVTFLGLVRNHNVGRRVRHLEYEAYEPLARTSSYRRRSSLVRVSEYDLQYHRHHHDDNDESHDAVPCPKCQNG